MHNYSMAAMRDAPSTSSLMPLRFLLDRSVHLFTTRCVLCVGLLACGLLGCGHDTTAPVPSPSESYWALRANYHAVNIATVPGYDTVRLTAVPLSVTHDTLMGIGSVTYSAKDSAITVDSTGLVTAHFATAQASVVVSLQYQHVTLADTVFIRVTDTVPHFPLAALSIQPQPDGIGSARIGIGAQIVIPVYATNTSGSSTADTVCNVNSCPLLIDFSSSDVAVAAVDNYGIVRPYRPGPVTFYATTYAYGITKRDSLPFVIEWPTIATVIATWTTPIDSKTLVPVFSPRNIVVNTGAHITWANGGLGDLHPVGDSIDVVFDDPTAVQPSCGSTFGSYDCVLFPAASGGNIAPFFPDVIALQNQDFAYFSTIMQSRTFPVAGTYTYHSKRYPSATGKVTVKSGF
jgi:hypothetical protein